MFIFIAVVAVGVSLKLIRKIFIKQSMGVQIIPMLTQYFIVLIIAVGFISIAAGVEAYISPELMKSAMSYINR